MENHQPETNFAQSMFLANQDSLPQMLSFVETHTRAKLSELGQHDDMMIFRAVLVCEELCVNSVLYGFQHKLSVPPARPSPTCQQTISLALAIALAPETSAHRLVLRYQDTASPFNPLLNHSQGTDQPPPQPDVPGGLGLVLINALAEQITYQTLATGPRQPFRNQIIASFTISPR